MDWGLGSSTPLGTANYMKYITSIAKNNYLYTLLARLTLQAAMNQETKWTDEWIDEKPLNIIGLTKYKMLHF